MNTFLVIFAMFLLMITLMALGVMFKRKPISGSCGGLSNVGVEKACDCDKPCQKRLLEDADRLSDEPIYFEVQKVQKP
ncbi:MAG: Na(+)-translocating NADH-quinone reductase subunit E [Gammaproteobacteria bacterium]|nr:MAG: Na(+)-translocating NADH-quinone reductase subunit E [Gammaproteobacteria bacterium]